MDKVSLRLLKDDEIIEDIDFLLPTGLPPEFCVIELNRGTTNVKFLAKWAIGKTVKDAMRISGKIDSPENGYAYFREDPLLSREECLKLL